MKIESLEWDSNFFSRRVGVVQIKHAEKIDLLNKDHFDLIYVMDESSKLNPKQLTTDGFKLGHSSTKLTYQWLRDEQELISTKAQAEIQEYTGSSNSDLIDLALISGAHSRFNLDPNFTKDEFYRMYSTWIDNSLNGQLADLVLVAERENRFTGLVTLKIDQQNNGSSIGLMAVHPKQQGFGIGTALMNAVKHFIVSQKIHSLTVATQLKNKQACSFYKRNGLHLFKRENIHHLWRN